MAVLPDPTNPHMHDLPTPSALEIDAAVSSLHDSPTPAQRQQAIDLLSRAKDERAISSLFNLLVHCPLDSSLEENALKALIGIGIPAIPYMNAELTSPNRTARQKAALVLSHLHDARIFASSVEALKDPSPTVRNNAIWGISRSDRVEVLPLLLNALNDTDPWTRTHAAMALALPKYRNPQTFSALMEAAKDPFEEVREHAVIALAEYSDPQVLPTLLEATQDKEIAVRAAALKELGKMREPLVIPLLLAALKDPGWLVLRNATEALAELGERDALITVLLASPRMTPAKKLDTLETLRITHFKWNKLVLDYRFHSVDQYCQTRLQIEPDSKVRHALEGIITEILKRQHQQQLLRSSYFDALRDQDELLRLPNRTPSRAEEHLLHPSSNTTSISPRKSWIARLLNSKKQ